MSPWTATVVSTDYNNKILLVGVSFTNGQTTFTDSFDMTGGNLDSLTQRIQGRLNLLSINDSLVLGIKSSIASSVVINSPIFSSVQGINPSSI